MAVNQLIRAAAECPLEAPRFAFIAPYLKQAKDIAWDYMHKYAGAIVPDNAFNEAELRADLPGNRRIRLYGADNPDSIQGIYLDGVVMDEYQFTHPRVFKQIVRPMLADRKGWVLFLGKPLGHNHFYELYEKMRQQPQQHLTRLYRASETRILDDEELALMREDLGEELYAQEVECSFHAAILGAYYAKELAVARAQHRIKTLPWEPTGSAVETYWDLGYSDSTAIIFVQRMGRELHLIDYYENRKLALDVYVKVVREKPYLYERHHLPHDAGQHEQGSGRTLAEQAQSLGLGPIRVHPKNTPIDGINQVRLLFPRLWFDETTCADLLEALASYRQEYDEKHDDFRREPLHDWASHGADALRLLACDTRLGEDRQRPPTWKPRPSRVQFSGHDPFKR